LVGKLLSYFIVTDAVEDTPTVPTPISVNPEVVAVETNSFLNS